MRPFALAVVLSLAVIRAASAEPATPGSENDRYRFNPVADGVLRLDARTGRVSHCSRIDAGWACKEIPDERSALESEIARLQKETTVLKNELLARGLPIPDGATPAPARSDDPRPRLPSDAEVDRVMSFVEKLWRRVLEMATTVQRDVERKN
jgi:hypothetical protein